METRQTVEKVASAVFNINGGGLHENSAQGPQSFETQSDKFRHRQRQFHPNQVPSHMRHLVFCNIKP